MSTVKKCLVWDLDDTVWDGISLEESVTLRPEAHATIVALDGRGILHSVASRGTEASAMTHLRRFGLAELFLVPKINWLPKPQNVVRIARELAIGLDTLAFIDDDAFERAQMAAMLPEVLTFAASAAAGLPDLPCFQPGAVTAEARTRRASYRAEQRRRQAASNFPTREAFLQACAMRLHVRPMAPADSARVRELMTRTHRCNTTGWVPTDEELGAVLAGARHTVHVAELTDTYGAYGIIGVAIVDARETWRLTYFALSCRVLGRGVERAFLSFLLNAARERGYTAAEAMYRETGSNIMMRTLYQMTGFRPASPDAQTLIFIRDLATPPPPPPWVGLR